MCGLFFPPQSPWGVRPPKKITPLVVVFFKAPNRELMARARGYLELEMLFVGIFGEIAVLRINEGYV